MSKVTRHGYLQLLHNRGTLREISVEFADIGGLYPASTVVNGTVELPVPLHTGILGALRAIRERDMVELLGDSWLYFEIGDLASWAANFWLACRLSDLLHTLTGCC